MNGQGWTGKDCDVALPCNTDPCQNGGQCTNIAELDGTFINYSCSCDSAYTGTNCEHEIPCNQPGDICLNNGVCSDNSNDVSAPTPYVATCACSPVFTGATCELPVLCHALNDPCQNSATCSNSLDFLSYTCDCSTATDLNGDAAWTGENCDIDIPCVTANDPCQNSATCSNSVDFLTAICDCSTGTDVSGSGAVAWTGLICDVEIPCVNPIDNPCNLGTCSNDALFAGYTCACPTDYRVIFLKCRILRLDTVI